MTDQERLKALDAACPGASAEFIIRHLEAQTAINTAQQEWCSIVFAENTALRGKVASLEAALAEAATTAMTDLPKRLELNPTAEAVSQSDPEPSPII